MTQWNAVVLAADRGSSDPVAMAGNVAGKALAEIQGITLIERVITSLVKAECIDKIFTLGPSQECLESSPTVNAFLGTNITQIIAPAKGPSSSALRGVMASSHYPTLVVTCDLPLLSSSMIEHYCQRLANVDADFIAGAIDHSLIADKMPELKKTQYQFNDGTVCFANLFALKNAQGLKTIEFWQSLEESRKKPIQLIRKIDWLSLINYKLGRLSLEQLTQKLSQKVGAKLWVEKFSVPELAIDVDSAHDYKVLSSYLKQ